MTPREIGERSGEPGPRIRKRKSGALERLRKAFLRSAEAPEEANTAGAEGTPGGGSSGVRILKRNSASNGAP
jgi:hypothetical protein